MNKATLVRGARQLLTLRGASGPRRGTDLGNLGIIQDGAVLIAGRQIVEVGPSRRLENLALARGADEIDASGCVVLPGFVDSDFHLLSNAHELSPRALKTLALRALQRAVRHGTTAIGVKTRDLKALRVHAALRDLPFTVVSTFLAAGLPLEAMERAFAAARRRRLAEFAEIGCDADAILAQARRIGWGLKVNADAALAVELGATSVDNVAHVTERDAILLAHSQTVATLSPGIAFRGEDAGYAPARLLIDSGVAVALASGLHQPNMQIPIAVACRSMGMTVAEAISAATINGAHAIGRSGSIGSIEAGKGADLAILGVPDYRELPYHFGVNLVSLVISRGTVLVERPEVKWPAH